MGHWPFFDGSARVMCSGDRLAKAPGARPHIPVSPPAPTAGSEATSSRCPAFRVVPLRRPGSGPGADAPAVTGEGR